MDGGGGGAGNEGACQTGKISEEEYGRRRKGTKRRLNERVLAKGGGREESGSKNVNKMWKAIRAAEPNPQLENNMVL